MSWYSILFITTGFILGSGLGFIVIPNYFSNITEIINGNTRDILYFTILSLTVLFIAKQAFYTRRVAEFTAMPSVAFDIKSGKTYFYKLSQQTLLNPRASQEIHDFVMPLNQLLYTRLFIKNISKFPIYFWIEINVKVKYKNGNVDNKPSNPTMHSPWIINPETTVSFPREDMLPDAILRKSYKEIKEEDKKIFDKIEEIVASFKISYAPLVQKGLKFQLKAIKWRFDLEEMIWLDPQSTKDYNIKELQ